MSCAVVALAACSHTPAQVRPVPDGDALRAATAFLDSAVAAGAAPGALLAVSVRGHRFYHGTGRLGLENAARPDSTSVYDLASLTKVVGLTTAVMFATDEGRLDLDAPLQRYVPAFQGAGKELVTIRHLLTHSSGLRAGRPLYRDATDRAGAFALTDTTALDTLPGVRTVYSDLGAILLTQAVERVYGTRLDSLLDARVFGPLGMTSTRYLPPAAWLGRIAPTENDPWRGRMILGEVHDENASRMGGVSGHAGLFSDGEDLLTFGEWLLQGVGVPRDGGGRPGAPLTPWSLPRFIRRQHIPDSSSRALGWDTAFGETSAGHRMAVTSFGHTGFTGTSIWIDPTRDLVVVLLSNRVHPTRANSKWGPVRSRVADRVVESLFPVAAH